MSRKKRPSTPKPVNQTPRTAGRFGLSKKSSSRSSEHRTTESRPRKNRPSTQRPEARVRSLRPLVASSDRATNPASEVSYRMVGVALIAIVLVAFMIGPVKQLLKQEQQVRQINAQIVAETQRQQELKDLIARWDDPDYVAAQARSRLGYTRKGETQYVVVDPTAGTPEPAASGAPHLEGPVRPWFTVMSDSLAATGQLQVRDDDKEAADRGNSPVTPE